MTKITRRNRRNKKQKAKAYGKKKLEKKQTEARQAEIDKLMAKIITPESENYELLSKVSDPYEDYGSAQKDIEEMKEVLDATNMGVGLAATQIGIMRRALVWRKTPVSEIEYMLNPVILDKSDEVQSMFEGCLSYPGFIAEIERPVYITVKWYEFSGKEHIKEFTGWQARILQHEIDHLAGVCLVGSSQEEDRKYVEKKRK